MTRDTSVTSLRDLRGKTILNTGKGASPEFALHDLLRGNGIDPTRDLTIEYRSEATEVVAALTVDPKAVGVVPDPFATILQVRSPGWRPALDLTTEWTKVHPDSQLVMGVTELVEGCVWNTMPPHTHERRMEVYMYFNVPEGNAVFHYMGKPDETRHIAVTNGQAVISPSWSIHSGVGTRAYSFCWGMGGENQAFDDMDHLTIDQIK